MRTSSQLLLTFLLNACWQIALVTVVTAVCARLLRGAAARYRHLLWVAALTISFSLPVLTSSYLLGRAGFSAPAQLQATAEQTIAGSAPLAQPILVDTTVQLPTSLSTPSKETGQFIFIGKNVAAIVIGLYLLLLCYLSGKLCMAWKRTRAISRSAYPVDLPERIRTIVNDCQTALGVRRVRVLCSVSVFTPVTVGSLNPLIILPEPLLQEADRDVLTSAIGHELAHVLRRDYVLNLLYELISLPLAFHPAMALVRRRIRETRELGCDELVTERLLDATVYARSLVRLAGAAASVGRPTSTLTVGIADADILEERVMTILRSPKTNVRRKNLSLVAAALIFVAPCAVATPFALSININPQGAVATQRQSATVAPGTLATWLKSPGETVERGDVIAEVKTDDGLVKAEADASGVIERLLVQIGEKVPAGTALAIIRPRIQSASGEVLHTQQEERERNEVSKARLKAQAELEAQRRAERETLGEAVTLQTLDGVVTFRANMQDPQREAREREERMLKEARLKEERGVALMESQDPEIVAHRRAEREAMAKRQAELAKEARLTMQQAIQIATSQYPGAVLESRLVRERNQACYILAILSDNGAETSTTRVLMSAIDGSIINAMKQDR